jgi:hypothetical protein
MAAMRRRLTGVAARLRGPQALGEAADAILAWSERSRMPRLVSRRPQHAGPAIPEPD